MTAQNHKSLGLLTGTFLLLSMSPLMPLALRAQPVALGLQTAPMQIAALRTISGTVTDPSGEPLKGAIVELENQDSHAVTSYLTDDAGHFLFRHLDSQTDFTVAVKYRGHHAKSRSVSKFNAHLQTVLNFKVKLN